MGAARTTPGAGDVLLVDPDAWDVDGTDLDADLDADLDDGPARRATHRPRRSGRRTAALVAGGALAVVVVLVGSSELLRSPQERLEGRLTDALEGAGVHLAEPVSLDDDEGDGQVWTGRLRVVGAGGAVSGVRVALRPEGGELDPSLTTGLFPLVDCGSRFPLSWAGDSDTSFRTTRADLAECVTDDPRGGALVTIAWRTDEDDDGADGVAGRQTWLTDSSGGVVWLHNGPGDGGPGGLTGAQQRAVATSPELVAPL